MKITNYIVAASPNKFSYLRGFHRQIFAFLFKTVYKNDAG